MNRIGLPATGQQDILTECNDMYTIEVRHRDASDWLPTGFTMYPAPVASRFVRDLNSVRPDAKFPHLVFRSRLVEAAQ